MLPPYAIDRIDSKGNIREHRTYDGKRTLCGRVLLHVQDVAGNAPCRMCERLAASTPPTCETCEGRGWIDEACESAIAGMSVASNLRPICDECEGTGKATS